MRTIRPRRVAVLFAASLGLLATMVPPASASSVETAVFEGDATLDGGLSYPCVTTATINPAKCPTVTVSPTITKPVTVTGGNTRNFTLSTNLCVSGANEAQGPPKLTVRKSAGVCVLKMSGTITGSCDTSSGLFTWLLIVTHTLVGALFDGTTAKTFADTVVVIRSGSGHWSGTGGILVATGSVTGGGALVGVIQVTPFPELNGITIGNSCLNKTADTFEFTGALTLIIP